MKINFPHEYSYINNYSKTTKNFNLNKNFETESRNIYAYPSNYYLSFGRISAKMVIDKIGEENFPSEQILENFKNLGRRTDVTLYDVHKQHYSKLQECTSLDEAKAYYPEFRNVKDAKKIDKKDMTRAMKKIAGNEIEGISIDKLSLDLLKKYYYDISIPADITSETYYNLSRKTIERIFALLNIKRYDSVYLKCLVMSKPEFIDKKSKEVKKTFQEHPEIAKEHSEYMKKVFANKDKRIAHSKLIREVATDTALVEKQKERAYILLSKHPELALTKSIASSLHPEISEIRSRIAQNYPELGIIFRHIEDGEKLTGYEKSRLAKYNREWMKACPDAAKIIGEEQKKWLSKYRAGEITLEELENIAHELKNSKI